MVSEGVMDEETVIVIELELAVRVVAHAALLVSTQVIMSPLFRVLSLYVAEPEPTSFPFFFH